MGEKAIWITMGVLLSTKKENMIFHIFDRVFLLLWLDMRIRSNMVPPTLLSRPYSLSGRTVVKVGVGGNYRKLHDMHCSTEYKALYSHVALRSGAGLRSGEEGASFAHASRHNVVVLMRTAGGGLCVSGRFGILRNAPADAEKRRKSRHNFKKMIQ